MKELRDKKKKERILYSKAMILLLLFALTFLLSATWGVYRKFSEVRASRDQVIAERGMLENHEKELRKEIRDLETLRGIEREIREKFGFAKEGEGVVVLVDPVAGMENDKDRNGNGTIGAAWRALQSLFR